LRSTKSSVPPCIIEEVRLESPDYALAIEAKELPWIEEAFPVPDYEAPGNLEAFRDLAKRIANRLRSGEGALIHCGAGIGRRGTLAICVLIALRMRPEKAKAVVEKAGSGPEVESQKEVIDWVAEKISKGVTR
jgi:protein-tyrosine phosphatase